jgi:hypothetical protein
MVIFYFWISIVRDNENCLLLLKIVPGAAFWPLGPTGTLFLTPEKKE